MLDSTCVMQSFFPSSNQQGGSVHALGESVSLGKFSNQNLEWDKFSAFNQNRYLEEAQRLAKPGLVAQRKALFEAHFKKPVADKVPDLLKRANLDAKNAVQVLRNGFNKENLYGEPYKDMGSAKSTSGFYIKAAKSRADALWRVDHRPAAALIESHSGELQNSVKSDAISENKNSHDFLVRMDGPVSNMAGGAFENLKVSQHLDSLHDTYALNQSKIVDISTNPGAIRLDKIPVLEPMENFVFASTVDSEPALSSSTSIKKRAVLSPCKLGSRILPMKENNAPENSKASGTGMVNRKRVVGKPLDLPVKQNSSLPVTQKPLTVKELDRVKYSVNSVMNLGSKVHSDQVMAELDGSEALSSNRKLSAEPDLKPASTQLKQKMNATRSSMTSMRKSVGQKERSKWNILAFSQKMNGTETVSTSSKMKTFSSRAPANQFLSDDTHMGKHTLLLSNTPSFGMKLTIQSHKNSQNKYESKVIQMNSALTLPQNNLKKPVPKAVHVSVSPSCNFESVKRSTTAPNCRSSRITALDSRVSKENSNHMQKSLQKSMQTSAARQFDDKGSKRPSTILHESSSGIKTTKSSKRPSTILYEPSSGIKTTKRPPTTTAVTPFRFRSDERAAIRNQKLEGKSSFEAENASQIKRKVVQAGAITN